MNKVFIVSIKLVIVLSIFSISCKKEKVVNCNNLLSNCGGFAEFCTFGYKWGKDNPFSDAGYNKQGPASGQVEISYSFQDEGLNFNTHSQSNLKSIPFENLNSCAKQQARNAFLEWESQAAIKFIEKPNNSNVNIRILAANITQLGIGYPPLIDEPCEELSGLIIIRPNSKSCDELYNLFLHEIGHALGLGHVSSLNIMNPDSYFNTLQQGDIKGIQSIYGRK